LASPERSCFSRTAGEELSNIAGLGQIRFPAGRITAAFDEVRQVLEREGFAEG